VQVRDDFDGAPQKQENSSRCSCCCWRPLQRNEAPEKTFFSFFVNYNKQIQVTYHMYLKRQMNYLFVVVSLWFLSLVWKGCWHKHKTQKKKKKKKRTKSAAHVEQDQNQEVEIFRFGLLDEKKPKNLRSPRFGPILFRVFFWRQVVGGCVMFGPLSLYTLRFSVLFQYF
jgi:hypothetical protein